MKNKVKAFGIIFKSHIKNWKMVLIIFLTCMIPLVTLNQYNINIKSSVDDMYKKGVSIYGDYDILIQGIKLDQIEEIIKEDYVKNYEIEYIDGKELKNRETIEYVYTSEKIFNLEGYKLESGRFPENDHEILCEASFYNRMVNSDSSDIEIDGVKYKVTGIIVSPPSEIYFSDINLIYFNIENFAFDNKTLYTIYIDTGSKDNVNIKKSIVKKYDLDKTTVQDNILLMSFLGTDETYSHTDIRGYAEKYSFYFIFIVSIILTLIIFKLCEYYTRKSMKVYEILGFPLLYGYVIYFFTYILTLLISYGIIYIISCFAYKDYRTEIMKICNQYALVYIIVVLCWKIISFCFEKFLKKESIIKDKNLIKKIRLKRSRGMFLKISRQNIRFHRTRYFFVVFAIVINMIFISGINYYFSLMEYTVDDTEHDYKLDIDDTSLETELLLAIDNSKEYFDYNKIYSTQIFVKINKSIINQEYKDFLINSSLADFSNEYVEYVDNIPMIVIAYNEGVNEILGCNIREPIDNEAFISDNIIDLAGAEIDIKMDKGHILFTKYNTKEEDVDYDINIKEKFSYSNHNILNTYGYPVLIVSKDFYSVMTGKNLPSQVFVDIKKDYDIYKVFSGIFEVKKIWDNSMVEADINSYYEIMNSSISVVKNMTLLYISIFILLIFIFNMLMFRKVFGYLSIIGFDKMKISKIYMYDNLYIFLYSSIMSFVFSIVVTKAINFIIGLNVNMSYIIPWKVIIRSFFQGYGIIFMVMVITYILSLKSISAKNI